MEDAFKDKTAFEENISGWDVSNVTNMAISMFKGQRIYLTNQLETGILLPQRICGTCVLPFGTSFDQAIGNWNTSTSDKYVR